MGVRYVSAVPAYGRDYTSQKAVLADWNAGKDFLIQDYHLSGYINKNEKPANIVLNVRYNKLQKVLPIK